MHPRVCILMGVWHVHCMYARRHEADERAVVDVLAALEQHAPRESVEALVRRLGCWVLLGRGLFVP